MNSLTSTSHPNRLGGKVALITGGASGIGAAAARLFVAEGARLMLADRLESELQGMQRELGAGAVVRTCDVSREDDMKALVDATIAAHGRVDVALLNAGISGSQAPLPEASTEEFDRVMAVNVRGVFLGLKYLMPHMAKQGGGSIIVTASTSGLRATPGMTAYTTSKHAAIGLMRSAAIDGAPHGIRVNSVNPATIDTPFVHRLVEAAKARGGGARPGAQLPISYQIPLGRQGRPEEVAHMMLFLASDESSFCSGGTYLVDGGATGGRPF